ncbi:hypothetical protein E2986_04428 [Frieseomelitta varia]|uniref:Large ribosomal subunit protein mL64 n=1 Tax=Frieseomelitta varia TaxID=561572 RepID=A0A833RPC8_9HYME|nr:growth arrest and DNA damage-inducible proteins-interacting protein 1 [Frieseomelitta varia]KAF3423878.1 hypothetical protein E2986_04428 [Frieseomelitta varia]
MSIKRQIFNVSLKLRFQNISARCYSSNTDIIESAEEEPIFVHERNTVELEKKRNKSRLTKAHRNILLGQKPYEESQSWYHDTVRYKRRTLGRYGMEALGVPAGLAWPTPEEVEDMKEYESLAHPLNIQERLREIKEKKKMEEEAILARQAEIQKKMATMQELINNVHAKIAAKQEAELEAKKKKESRIEEIRRQLIAEGTMSKDKLAEALSKAEKDEKKLKKAFKKARMIEKQQEYAEKLLKKEAQTKEEEDHTADSEKR